MKTINLLDLKTINIFITCMNGRQTKANISNMILSSISQNLVLGSSKLSQLQHIYTSSGLGFQDFVSPPGRQLTKKIFGAAVKCLNTNQQQTVFVNSKNLVALSFVLLSVAFQDEYCIKEIVKQINECQPEIDKMFKIYNPYKRLNINSKDFQKILVQIILKINSWNVLVNIYNNLQQYSVATQTMSILLRAFLARLNYHDARDLSKNLQNTQQVFSIICDFFGLNIISHRASALRKRSNVRHQEQQELGQSAVVFLFNNNNLFISTVDGQQFCCGRYYSNQTQLQKNQNQLSKSTLQYMFKCKKAEQKQVEQENQQSQDRFQVMRVSQLQLDLGMSTSGFCPSQGQTPVFPNNQRTPEFGNMMESFQFRKSIDFQSAQKLIPKNKHQKQIIEEQQVLSPGNSELQKAYDQKVKSEEIQDRFINVQNYSNKNYQKKKQFVKPSPSQDQDAQKKPRYPLFDSYHVIRPNTKISIKQNDQKRDSGTLKRQRNQLIMTEKLESQFSNSRQLKGVPIQASQCFVKNQPVQKKGSPTPRKKKQSLRKYSVNEAFTSQLKQTKKKQKNIIHHSNHFSRAHQIQNHMAQNGIQQNHIQPSMRQTNNAWQNENCRSEKMISYKKAQRKMEFASNIVNIHVSSSKNLLNDHNDDMNMQQIKYYPKKNKSNHKKFMDLNQRINKLKNFTNNFKFQHQNSPRTENTYTIQGGSVYGFSSKINQFETFSAYQLRNQSNFKNQSTFNGGSPIKNLQVRKSPRKNIQKKCPQFLKSPKQKKNIHQMGQKRISNKSIKKSNISNNTNNKDQKQMQYKHIEFTKKSSLKKFSTAQIQNQKSTQNKNSFFNSQSNLISSQKLKTDPIQAQQQQGLINHYKNKHYQSDSNLNMNFTADFNSVSSPINANINERKMVTIEKSGQKNWQYFGKGIQSPQNNPINLYPSYQYGLAKPILNQNHHKIQQNHQQMHKNIQHHYFDNRNHQINNKMMTDYRIRQQSSLIPTTNITYLPSTPIIHRNNQVKYMQPVITVRAPPQNNLYMQNNLISCQRQKFNTAASSTVFSPTVINSGYQSFYEYQKSARNPYSFLNPNPPSNTNTNQNMNMNIKMNKY